MTDARHPERWLTDRRLLRLTDGEYRLFSVGLLFAVANRTDGAIDRDDLALFPGRLDLAGVEALCAAGLWQATASGWQIVDFIGTQTTRDELAVLENVRRRERQKKARQRAGGKNDVGESPRHPPGGRPRGHVPGTTQEGQEGEDRHLQEPRADVESPPNPSANVVALPAADPPSPLRRIAGQLYEREW